MNPWWILAAVAVVAFLVWLVRWALGEPLERDRVVAEARDRTEPLIGTGPEDEWVYDGPDQLRLLEDTERFVDRLVADDPALAAGFDRLRQAIREHREEEGT